MPEMRLSGGEKDKEDNLAPVIRGPALYHELVEERRKKSRQEEAGLQANFGKSVYHRR